MGTRSAAGNGRQRMTLQSRHKCLHSCGVSGRQDDAHRIQLHKLQSLQAADDCLCKVGGQPSMLRAQLAGLV